MNPNQNDPNQVGRTSNTFNVTNENAYSGRARITNSFDAINGLNGGQLTEKQVREIVKDEMIKNANSGTPITPRHYHDNNGSPKINQTNIIPNPTFNGSILMTQGTLSTGSTGKLNLPVWAYYRIPTTTQPSSVRFYGGASNLVDSPHIHALIIGECALTTGYQYQTGTVASGGVNNSVSIGTIPVQFVQGSATMIMTNGAGGTGAGATSILLASQFYIAYAADGAGTDVNFYAVAEVLGFDGTALIIRTAFATNWTMTATWVVS